MTRLAGGEKKRLFWRLRRFNTEITQGAFHGFTAPLVSDVHFINQRLKPFTIPPKIRGSYFNSSKNGVELYCRISVNCQSFGFFLATISSRVTSKIFWVALRPISWTKVWTS